MPFCSPPQLIAEDPPIFAPEDPGFESFVGSQLPDPDAWLQGLDAILNTPIGSLAADLAALSTLDTLIAAATFTPGDWAAANITPLLTLYATLGVSGDSALGVILGLLANMPVIPGVPTIPPDPGFTLEIQCGPCSGESGPITIINITDLPGGEGSPPAPPTGGGDCLNKQPSGGYAPGPCPSQGPPADAPPPDEPPPDEPPPDDPPPDDPPDQGDGGGFDFGGGGYDESGYDPGASGPPDEG